MKNGFTLAEVLITLGIIGVVAAFTLPTLIVDYQKKATLSQLKKTYSALSQAVVQAESEYEQMVYWGLSDIGMASNWEEHKKNLVPYIKKYFLPYLNVGIDCGHECSALKPVIVRTLSGIERNWYSPWSGGYVVFLNDGTLLNFWADNLRGYMNCLNIDIDVNGFKGPNTYGKDIFVFHLDGNTRRFNLYGADLTEAQITNAGVREACSVNGTVYAGFYCGGWIQRNSWQFPENYPW